MIVKTNGPFAALVMAQLVRGQIVSLSTYLISFYGSAQIVHPVIGGGFGLHTPHNQNQTD